MQRFQVFKNGEPAPVVDVSGAHLIGSDGVPLRADIDFREGFIRCQKRTEGAAGLVLLWPIEGVGRVVLETTRLPERKEPYNLHVELARGRLTRIVQKREDWGLYEYDGLEELVGSLNEARDLFIESLKADDPAIAASFADRALQRSVDAGEKLSLFHSDVFLDRRRQSHAFARRLFGCTVDLNATSDSYREQIPKNFEFATLPVPWRVVEPKEQEFDWAPVDGWIDWLSKNRVPIKMSPLVSFSEKNLPDWLYIWEHDFETVRDLVYEHVRRVVQRYGPYVTSWVVVSGIHAENAFNYNFEQLMELSRMAAALTKQLAPRASTIIELIAPWGEYYARNQRTIPPMLYADMAVQGGITFDAFGLQSFVGVGADGMYVRDMFQVSSMIDRFGSLGKPLHITGTGAPSNITADANDAWGGALLPETGGQWHEAWSDKTQAAWLRCFYQIALSKPYVESITWRDLADVGKHCLPHGGLFGPDFKPKPALDVLRAIREEITGSPSPATRRPKHPPQG